MTNLTHSSQRQLDLIADRLKAYRERRVSLRRLVDDLDSLWNELADAPKEWRERFRGSWWSMEQVLAVAIDRGQVDAIPEEQRVMVDEAADQIGFLVDELRASADLEERDGE